MSEPGYAEEFGIEIPSVDGLMEQVRRQQEEVLRIQRGIETMEVTGRSRDNEVSARVRGTGRLAGIDIDEDFARRVDVHELGEIVTEAVNDAFTKLAEASSARFAPIMEAASQGEVR